VKETKGGVNIFPQGTVAVKRKKEPGEKSICQPAGEICTQVHSKQVKRKEGVAPQLGIGIHKMC